jgi:protein TilB
MYNKQGEIRQCNEEKYPFHLREYDHPEYSYFEVEVPEHMETKDLEINISPTWVSIRIRGKLTQLRLSE